MSGYDQLVDRREQSEIEVKAYDWRDAFDVKDAWVPDLARILEHQLPRLVPGFALRIRARDEMADELARTWHSVPAIDV